MNRGTDMLKPFTTQRMVLRQFDGADAPQLAEAVHTSPHLRDWLEWSRKDYGIKDAEAFISMSGAAALQGSGLALGGFLPKTGRLLVSVGLTSIEAGGATANLGYWVRTGEEGKGYVTEACQALISRAHSVLGIARIEVAIRPDNVRSIKVAQALKLEPVGGVDRRIQLGGELVSAVVYVSSRR